MRVFNFLIIGLIFSSCMNIKDKKTSLSIVDNNRYYYPILQGQELVIAFEIENTGKHPFVLSEIFTSCGCVVAKQSSIKSIPAGKSRTLFLNYNSTKNIGKVKHYITLYGNLLNEENVELTFNVNVVPDAHYTQDYEQLHLEYKRESGIEQAVDGKENNKGYYFED